MLTALLALLGLLLAFTYSFSLGRYDDRRQAAVAEANALGTAFLRADLLPEPGRTELRQRLLNYTRTRDIKAEMFRTREAARRTIERTMRAQAELWPAAREALTADVPAPIGVAVVTAINMVLDVHTERMAAGFEFIPSIVLIMLMLISAFSLGMMAYSTALQGNPSRSRSLVFAVVLCTLIAIIMDFDMPRQGFIRVAPADMGALIDQMETAMAR